MSTEVARRLVLVRHARAESAAPTDFERPLAERGRADAGDVGAWLAAQGIVPDRALVSAALRTTQTWEELSARAAWDLEPDFDRGLYSAGPETVLDLVREVPDAVATLLVVGHNPAMGYLAQWLDSGEGPAEAAAALDGDFPTAAVAVLGLGGGWADLDAASAALLASHVGRS